MKTIQLILRIILSPIVFFISFGAINLFPGPFLFMMSIIQIVSKLLGIKVDEDWDELILFLFVWIIYPYENTKSFIIHSKFID